MTPAEAPPKYLLDRVVHIDSSSLSSSLTSGTAGQVVKMSVGYAAPWFRTAVTRLEYLAKLDPDWDSYGAKPIQTDKAISTVAFLADVAATTPNIASPSIVPLPDGGVQVEWHCGGIDLEVAFSDEEPGVYLVDRTSDETVESPLRDARTEVLRVASRLIET